VSCSDECFIKGKEIEQMPTIELRENKILKLDNTDFKKIGSANIYSWFAVILPFAFCVTIMIFGYAILVATIFLFLILAVAIVCNIFRAKYLLKNKQFATKRRVVIESIFLLVSIVVSCVFTDVQIIYTATGFMLEQQLKTIFVLLIILFNLVPFLLQAFTNQKMGKEYSRLKKEQRI
jgi:hypothetical protein